MSHQQYTPEFKDEAVRQVTEKGHSVQEVAARLGVSSHSLYKWVKAVRPSKDEQRADELLDSKKEILKLRAELRRVQEERDILKEAAFGSTGQRNTLIEHFCWRTDACIGRTWGAPLMRLIPRCVSADPTRPPPCARPRAVGPSSDERARRDGRRRAPFAGGSSHPSPDRWPARCPGLARRCRS